MSLDNGDKANAKAQAKKTGAIHEDRPPPHDLNLEKAVLGAMLLDPISIDIALGKLAVQEVFYSPAHQRIFEVISKIHEKRLKRIDILSISNSLAADGSLEAIGGEAYLLELQNSIPTSANCESWCNILRNLHSLRKMISVCASTLDQCYSTDTDDIPQLLDGIEKSIFEVRDVNQRQGSAKIGEYTKTAVKQLESLYTRDETSTGIPTGYPDLDKMIMGLKKAEMFVLAARPSIGKTSLAMNLAYNVALGGKTPRPIAFFSLEMTAEELTKRLLCSMAEVSSKDFYEKRFSTAEFGRIWSKVTGAASALNKSQIYIDPTPALSINELRAKAMRLSYQYKIEVIFIDYLQLMRADVSRNDNRQTEVAKISVGIKALAKDLNVPIVVLAQLNRQAEGDSKPKLSHLRESGAIEQDADVVAFLHRDRDAQKDAELVAANKGLPAELIVEKNRNGDTGKIDLLFFPKITSFLSASRYGESDVPGRDSNT